MPLVVAGGLAGVSAAALSLVILGLPVLLVWLGTPDLDLAWPQMLDIAGTAWLAAQGLSIAIGEVPITLLPIGLALVPLVIAWLAGRWAGRRSAVATPGEAGIVAGCAGIGYGVVAAGVATMTGAVPAALAFAVGGGLVGVVAGVGALASSGQLPGVRRAVPAALRAALAGGLAGAMALLAISGVLVAVALIARAHEIGVVVNSLGPDPAGIVALVALSLGYLPVLLGWGMAYVVGTGIALGAGSSLTPLGADPAAALPALPLLAAIPDSVPTAMAALPAIVIALGALAGGVVRRRGFHGWAGVPIALGAAAVAALIVGALLLLSAGSIGTGRLADIGPDPLLATGIAAALIAIGAVITVAPRGGADDAADDAADDVNDGAERGPWSTDRLVEVP